ncbi:hypothetical protein LPTSP3_g34070 [Leptospira kobayashii]|uniref:Methyltransferase domain protein n=1 Tax=Leptospira kobayashii TaxID=1917830 RepID=A0ABN6KK05_9LEPT|nr:hypothetical protein [Leptospira kobayashii]BDA80477.1 hypothetical protein LPTSP3_g34070 [Leptospira kobayashii]
MENDPSLSPTPFLEIRDPQIDVKEIMRGIESKIPLPPPTKLELERISQMQFQPESPEGYRKFDPAGTAHLFEKGIAPPKFTNPKLWFVKGPIKFLFTRFIEFYGLVDKKLSENRIKAFFSVLHELIRLAKRMQNLEKRFESFYKDYLLQTDVRKLSGEPTFGWASYQFIDDAGLSDDWDLAISDMKEKGKLEVLFPEWGSLLKKLTIESIPFHSYTESKNEFEFVQKKITSDIKLVDSLFPLKHLEASHIIIGLSLNKFPSIVLERIFAEISGWLQPGGYLYFSIQLENEDNHSPFQDIQLSKIDLKKLPNYLKTFGLSEERDLTKSSAKKILRYKKIS